MESKKILLLACLGILILFFLLSISAPLLIHQVKSTQNMVTQFNFPRYKSQIEIQGSQKISGEIRYTRYNSNSDLRGRDINWTDIIAKGPYDVVVISDSFLGGCDAGFYFCKKLSVENNVSVLHLVSNWMDYPSENTFVMLVILTNNGFLEKTGAKYVVLSVAERGLPTRISGVTDLNNSKPLPVYTLKKERQQGVTFAAGSNKSKTTQKDILNIINTSFNYPDRFIGNTSDNLIILKTWIKNDILSLISDETNDGSLHFAKLNDSMFSNPTYSRTLIFIDDDITSFHVSNCPEDIIRVNANINEISCRLKKQNISLIFIPGISAYNTYYSYIITPPTVRDPFFEIMRELNKSYTFIDTKAISDELLAKNEKKDLSGIGDPAHWTWKITDVTADKINLTVIALDDKSCNVQDIQQIDYNSVVRAFRTVIYERGDSNDPWAYRNDGQVYEKFNDNFNALKCYKRSLELNPRQPDLREKILNISRLNL